VSFSCELFYGCILCSVCDTENCQPMIKDPRLAFLCLIFFMLISSLFWHCDHTLNFLSRICVVSFSVSCFGIYAVMCNTENYQPMVLTHYWLCGLIRPSKSFFFQMQKTFNNNVHIFVNSSQIDTTYSELFKYVFVVPRTFHLSCLQQTLSEKDPSKKMLQPVVG
jgi:hypothetical protein